MRKQIEPNEKRSLAKWTTRDLLVTAIVSVAFAFPLLGANYLLAVFIMPLGPLAIYASTGLWFIPPIFIVYIMRRPGAVMLGQLVMTIVSVPFSPFGWMQVLSAVVVGLPIELVFLLTRYRNYRLPILLIGGMTAGVVNIAFGWVPYGISLLATGMQITIVTALIVSSITGVLGAKLLAEATAKTGVLGNYAVGQELQEEV